MDIGIDLGTTFSVIAVKGQVDLAPGYSGAEYLQEIDVTLLPSANGNLTFPSAFWWHPDEPERYVFGDEAKQMAEEGKAPIMFSKRSIGTTNTLMLNGRGFTAKEVAERFLRFLKEWAETVTGQKVSRAVVTHPAYFDPGQREETLKAAQDAGLNVTPKQMMMEPCAAALAYTLNDTRDPLRVMTYDLGGGTFDVAVMEKIGGVIQMKKFDGDHLLGGYDFDSALVQWILDQLKEKGKIIPYDPDNEEHKGRRARMLQIAEAVKIRLAEQRTDKATVPVQVDFLVDNQGQRVQFRGQINREQYAALVQDRLRDTIKCCRNALEGAGIGAEDLHAILLVGGSTRGKWVADAVAREFGSVVGEPYYPDYCVAAGAALWMAQFAPPAIESDRIKLSLDYQSSSVLSTVNISGSVCPSSGSDLTPEACRKLQIHLEAPDGSLSGPAEIGAEGQFIFKKVELLQDGSPSRFKITVSENGSELMNPVEGTIVFHDESTSESGTSDGRILPVLPRCLFLKAERMVKMAEEGAPLPAKCQARLRRVFDGPTEEIPILLDNEQVGAVSIEDIPEEAGEGCMVVVDAEVTEFNEMRGKVLVYAPNGKTVLKEGPVRVVFPPVVIPELAELLGKFDELRDRLEMDLLHAPPQDRARLAGSGKNLVRKIKKITEEQSPDRQILHERIRELERIVDPPEDDMDPPRRDFDNLLAECRELLAASPENNALKAYSSQLDRVETAGKDACETKNNKKWVTANETLQRIHDNIERAAEGSKPETQQETPPPAVLKAQAKRIVEGLRASLKTARDARLREGNAERWEGHCEDCARKIDRMAAEIDKISDDTPKEQALAQIQSYLGPSETLRKRIERIQRKVSIETL
ncbi:MAG: Hsp70 family protein [Terracidiphilus sp.]